ncbi:MAG: hypothetical protein JWO12_3179 [Frankiales bacterium]|nr:hypothetical protein [Frankiales bacterium]
MRTGLVTGRVIAVSALAVGGSGALLVTAPAALAATATPPVVSSNWYWAEKAPSANGQALPALPDQADAASGVPAGDLGVGLIADQAAPADKVAAVGFDLTTVPLGATFSRFQVTVPVDPAGTNAQSAPPDISACENIDSFADAPGPSPLASAPPVSLPSCVKGKLDAAKGYVFDLTTMANDWSFGAPSLGITLRPTSTGPGTAPFSIALQGKNGIRTAAEYALPTAVVAPPADNPPAAPEVAPLPAVQGGGLVAAPPVLPSVDLPAPEAAPALPQPQVNPAPQAAAPATRATGLVEPAPSSTPSTGFWLALLAGAGLLALTRVVLNDPMAPEAADPRRRRFAQVVSSAVAAPRVSARPSPA